MLNTASILFSMFAIIRVAQGADYFFRRPGASVSYHLNTNSTELQVIGNQILSGGCGRIETIGARFNFTNHTVWEALPYLGDRVSLERTGTNHTQDGIYSCVQALLERVLEPVIDSQEESQSVLGIMLLLCLIVVLCLGVCVGGPLYFFKSGDGSAICTDLLRQFNENEPELEDDENTLDINF